MMIIGIIIIATMITVTGDITTVTNHLLGITEDEKNAAVIFCIN